MTICPDCEKKYVSQKQYDTHRTKVHGEAVEESPVEETGTSSGKIVLHFTRSVEIFVNGVPYLGTDVEVPNYAVASDIARIAREAYGNEVLK